MSPGSRRARGSSQKASLKTTSAEPAEEEHLYTSKELFGDFVDASELGSNRSAASRRAPIRVQVSESRHPATGTESIDKVMLPQDMEQLLDVFDDGIPHESKTLSRDDAPQDDSPAATLAPDPEEPSAEGEDSLVSLLESAASPPHWSPPSATQGDVNLGAGGTRDERKPGRSQTKKAGARFRVGTPPEPGETAVDLAMLVEEALGPPPGARGAAPGPSVDRFFGPYQLLDKIATGGMAEVFRAKRTGVEGFEKVVAVKRILKHLSENHEFVDMFVNEAKMVAGLAHPNIVQIFDLGRIGKSYFIAMEYVHGRDLRSIMRRTQERGMRIPIDLSVFIISRVCQALEYAHRKRDDQGRALLIVHRDVSPQNILISFEGEVKLTDFGIARAAAKARTTDSGALRGKLLYMSPEQAWNKPMDRRSDIFSLGLICYEMLTEQKPFVADSQASILEVVRECRITPPTTINPRIPDRIERVALKALARDPEDRYQDAGELYKDLDRILYERPQAPTMTELARFMAVLFDEQERGTPHPVEEPIEALEGWASRLEIEFDSHSTPTGSRQSKPREDEASVKRLLRRLGLK